MIAHSPNIKQWRNVKKLIGLKRLAEYEKSELQNGYARMFLFAMQEEEVAVLEDDTAHVWGIGALRSGGEDAFVF